jgi:hypothetical protein
MCFNLKDATILLFYAKIFLSRLPARRRLCLRRAKSKRLRLQQNIAPARVFNTT